jgi:adenine deaminase
VRAELALPLVGLISLEPWRPCAPVSPACARWRDLGCTLPEPFLQVAFLSLPVIPQMKITDFGLFDVDRFELVSQ